MAKRSRRNRGSAERTDGPVAATGADVDPALAAFATFIRSEQARERDQSRAARAAREAEREAERLLAEKDRTAAELKRLRSRSGVSPEERAEAEAAYRTALAAVIEAETGQAPDWAPPTPDPESPTGSDQLVDEDHGTPEADAEGPVEADGENPPDALQQASSDDAPADAE